MIILKYKIPNPKMLSAFLICLISFYSKGQIVKPLGNGIPNGVEAHCFYNNDLYVVYPVQKSKVMLYYISRWNGVFWSNLDSFNINTANGDSSYFYPRIYSMTFFNNELYIAGRFDSVIKVPDSRYIVKWSNKKWTGIGGRFVQKGTSASTGIKCMIVYKNQLIVAGNIDTLPGKHLSCMAAWNGSTWNYIGNSTNEGVTYLKSPDSTSINSMLVYKDTLYVFGYFTSAAGKKAINIAEWNGTDWAGNYSAKNYTAVYNGIFYNGDMYIFNGGIFKTKGSNHQWTYTNGSYNFITASFAVLNGRLLCCSDFMSDSLNAYNFAEFDGTKWIGINGNESINEFPQTIIDTSGGKLYMLGWFITNQKFKGIGTNAGIVDARISKISGHVYDDLNGNCKMDPADMPLAGKLIQTNPRFSYTYTDQNGYYELYLPSDNYKIFYIPLHHEMQTCPSKGGYYSVKALDDSTYNNLDFASAIIPNIKDLRISISCISGGYRAIKGSIEHYRINYANMGTVDIPSGLFYLNLPARVSNFSALPAPNSYTAPIAKWMFTNLKTGENKYIDFDIKTDTILKINETIKWVAGFDSLTNINDSNLHDNFDTLTQLIATSHDPNNKQSYPFGDITSATKEIKYMIHFQNTGTAPATKIVVIDTLDLALPLTDVVINSSSHPYTLQITDNVLIWTFDHINLPDSTTDKLKSQGYISFNTGIKEGVGTGKEIKNKAYIYFDFEQPVPTNTTLNTIVYQSTGIDLPQHFEYNTLQAYPNPANGFLTLENTSPQNQLINICDMLGKTIYSRSVGGSSKMTLDLEKYPSGIYFLRTNNQQAIKLILQH
jgi:uncharacterized repeat protein (TIGR01451 family)